VVKVCCSFRDSLVCEIHVSGIVGVHILGGLFRFVTPCQMLCRRII